jgi:1,4-dihydroxy-2-naphthoate octaprenyltransferase
MDHEAYENEMIDAINRHGEEATKESAEAGKPKGNQVVNKNDALVVARGLKRTLIALLTAGLFAISVIGLIAVASAHGYMAVLLFFASLVGIALAFILLYAQGITYLNHAEGQGESK